MALSTRHINRSGFPLLPGRMSAYVDNRLACHSSLPQAINLLERIEMSLGVDPCVRIEYKETATTTKIGGGAGFFAKASTVTTTFEQKATIKNDQKVPISVNVIDMVPKASDDSVKVTLLEPGAEALYKQLSMVRHSPDEGLLIWDLFIAAGKEVNVFAKYAISCPSGKMVKLTKK